MKNIQIKKVTSQKELKQFVLFPFELYAGNLYWVPSLINDDLATLGRNKNPAFAYCEAEYWLAYKNNKIVGRIAGIINKSYIEKWGNNYARFGWIDFIDDVAVSNALLETVQHWAAENGMKAIHGPLGFTDFDPEGMLVDGFNEPGTMSTIYNYAYYPLHLEKFGLKKDVDWLEFEITIPKEIPEKINRIASVVERRYKLHSLYVKKASELLPYANDIFDVLNKAYKDLYGVVTLSDEQIKEYTKQYFSFIQPEYVSVILDANNKVAAFAISMPSLSEALQKTRGKLFPLGFLHVLRAMKKNNKADLYLVAVRPDLQGKGLNAMLVRDLGKTFIKNSIETAITHPALEENNKVQALWKEYKTKLIKRRRCYIKLLK